ncbi:CvfB family protein [Konateibacter massiliensis]|uniref:CvfB family protein n=1 Tax=Konateibacter massiliensis TaxID=2002841 RepID=UPI000C162497|nr:S1-like domain-containing RNA-binding protein [Konateibacter massiliensis]
MFKLGKRQELMVVKEVEFGVYLAETQEAEDRILLPKKQVPARTKLHDVIEVFIYKDSNDRFIATVREPKLEFGQVAVLEVLEVGKIGAFLDWGLEKDLFLPFKEQTSRVKPGDHCLVALYIDKSQRLCATMNVYEYLELESPYQKEDRVTGTIYEESDEFGMFVAVDNKYSALISKKEAYGSLKIGDTVQARVINVKEDGRLDLSVREKAYLQMDDDSKLIMEAIEKRGGALPFNDKVSPEIIKKEFGLSKNAFKRAVGRLLKEGKIEITENSISKI